MGSEVDFSRGGREFVVKNFAKGLLDVMDDLRRVSFIGKDRFKKTRQLTAEVEYLKTVLRCLEEARKQIAEELKICDEFDPECELCRLDRDGAIPELQNFARSLADLANNLGWVSLLVKKDISYYERKKKKRFSYYDAREESRFARENRKGLVAAVQIIERQLDKELEKLGLRKFNSKGQIYNPDRHDIIIEFPPSLEPPGTIIAVMKAGYLLHGRMFRRAGVAIRTSEE